MFGVDDAALALIAAGIIGTAGQLYTNNRNLKYQSQVNDVNWQIAAMNNATQVDMANSAHQREVNDLKRAGLNPILSAGGSGASTPSLTSVRGDSAQIQNPVNDLASSARGLARYFGETYQTQLNQAKADLETTERTNNILSWEQSNARREADLQALQLELDSSVLHDLTHTIYRDSDGIIRDRFDDDKPYVQLYKEGKLAHAIDESNVNWRNNLKAVGGAVGDVSGLMSGASSLLRATDALRRTRPSNLNRR